MSSPLERLVLLVDDDDIVRVTIGDILEDLGFRVIQASNATDAIARLREARDLDLLVTDVLMPEMNGWTLAERVREYSPRLPIIYVTGYSSGVSRAVDRSLVIRKPFQVGAFAKAILEVIEAE